MCSIFTRSRSGNRRHVPNVLMACLFIALVLLSQAAQAQTSLRGSVKTADGKPVPSVTISIPSIQRSGLTDEVGEYRINRLPAGTYSVIARSIGLQSQEKQVTLGTEDIAKLDFVLTETSAQLEAVNINSLGTNKFAVKKSDYIARMPLDNLENPQVYTAVGKELIAEQQIVDFKEILRNVPGVAPNNNPAGGTGANIRGFGATTTVRNGLAVQSYQSDPINLERVEVIKGPSGTLFGSSIVSFGGLMNQVTKKPMDTFLGEVSFTLGSYELSRLTADINTPLNEDKTALLRINAAAHKENSFQNFGHKKMYTFAPSFSYKVSDRLTFLLEAELNKTNRSTVAYYQNLNNTSYKNFRDIPIGFDISLGGADIDAQLTANNFYGEAKYEISDKWTSTTSIAYGENQIDHSNQIYPQWTEDNKFNRTISNYGPRIFTSLNGQQNFNGDFKIGGLRNRLLVGVSFYTFRSFLRFTSVGTYDQIDLSASPIIPGINLEAVNAIVATKPQSNTENKQGSYSAYASDVLNITDRLMAMLSLRVDRFENAAPIANGVKAATGAYNQTAFSPKLGLTYQLVKDQLSVFGNYMNGFQNVGPVTQPTGTVDIFKPRQANQWEGGVKLEVLNKKLNATLSYYDIKISNDTRNVEGVMIQDATSKSKGFEAELIANPVDGLNIIAGYASNSYRILNASANIGNYQAQVPTDFINFWASYKFTGNVLKNIGLGFGGNYVSSCFFDAENTIVIPAYTVLNASVFYDQPKWRLSLKANNLSNERYWTNYGIPETLRQYLGTISFKF
ncbi:TonB-dependent receptor [Olivibacter domesticus]|uniref:Iron complex outermembrane recepter protein n=1 Tax=Olivibacter domesticus TaxID=407022 RepID=A0A1H7JJC4_OLID1|nr:TonB-dependent receptor [Olivibacter domesticus]SEK74544.1 iron complex outermembrane recepter protein [Olivibacter domesticus]